MCFPIAQSFNGYSDSHCLKKLQMKHSYTFSPEIRRKTFRNFIRTSWSKDRYGRFTLLSLFHIVTASSILICYHPVATSQVNGTDIGSISLIKGSHQKPYFLQIIPHKLIISDLEIREVRASDVGCSNCNVHEKH